jgi:hypothetical protein
MKKWIVLTMAVLVIVAVLVPAAFAQGPVNGDQNNGTGYGPGRMNGNGAGQCDEFVDEDGDGICDLAGTGQGQGTGPGYEDADGDGVCDHAGTGQQGQQGQRGQRGQRGGQGMRGQQAQ